MAQTVRLALKTAGEVGDIHTGCAESVAVRKISWSFPYTVIDCRRPLLNGRPHRTSFVEEQPPTHQAEAAYQERSTTSVTSSGMLIFVGLTNVSGSAMCNYPQLIRLKASTNIQQGGCTKVHRTGAKCCYVLIQPDKARLIHRSLTLICSLIRESNTR
jgi:hypothetical protein